MATRDCPIPLTEPLVSGCTQQHTTEILTYVAYLAHDTRTRLEFPTKTNRLMNPLILNSNKRQREREKKSYHHKKLLGHNKIMPLHQ